jgi:rRNA-processing protein FCF1
VVEVGRAPASRLVLLDTNALLSAVRLKIDLKAEVARVAPGWTPVVPACVVRELESLGARQHAAGARTLALRFPVIEAEGKGDRALIAAARAGRMRAVATNDRKLRAQLSRLGVPVLFIRGRRRLEGAASLGGGSP